MKYFVLALMLLSFLSCKKDTPSQIPPQVLASAIPRDGGVLLRFFLCNHREPAVSDIWCGVNLDARFDIYTCTAEGVLKDQIADQLAVDSLVVNGLNNDEVHHFKIRAMVGRTVAGWSGIISVMPGNYTLPEIVYRHSLGGAYDYRQFYAPSPDGLQLPFAAVDDVSWRLMLEDRASGTIDTLPQRLISSVLWSPDGQNMLIFNFDVQPHSVWRYERSTGLVTSYNGLPADCFSFRFSPDGQQVCFLKPGAAINTYDVCTMNLDGTNIQLGVSDIKTENNINPALGRPIQLLYWNPDQKTLYYNSYQIKDNFLQPIKVLRMNLETRQTEEVVTWSGGEFVSSVSPDGRRIVFHSTRSGSSEIWLQDLETGYIRQLTNQRNTALSFGGDYFVWSDNYHFLVFGSESDFSILCRFEVP